MTTIWQSDASIRTLLRCGIAPYLPVTTRVMCRVVCRVWAQCLPPPPRGEQRRATGDGPLLRGLTPVEVERLCARLRALRLPWSPATEAYIQDALTTRVSPVIPVAEEDPTTVLNALDRGIVQRSPVGWQPVGTPV